MWYLKRNYRYAKVNYKCGIQPYLTYDNEQECTLRCKTRSQMLEWILDQQRFLYNCTVDDPEITLFFMCNVNRRKNNAIVFNPFASLRIQQYSTLFDGARLLADGLFDFAVHKKLVDPTLDTC